MDAPGQQPPLDAADLEPLVLDPDELKALQIFHRSFNLPGIRLGLVTPVSQDDYFPPEEGGDDLSQAAALAHQCKETAALLQQAQEMLSTEVIEELSEHEPSPAVLCAERPGSHSRRIRKPTTPVSRNSSANARR